ncbi:MAG: RNA polymerase sigma factor [Isosphaeraceae bacterium]
MNPARDRAGTGAIARGLGVLWETGTLTGQSDAQLLGRFLGGGEGSAEPAFRELLDRHGPMVMAVCRQVLGRAADADDAFQATFLVLVRRARSIRVGDSLAPWLYAVAIRTARRARFAASRQRTIDAETLAETVEESADAALDLDVRPMLHEELARLPGKYREPIVLCHLEGKSHEEAARLLAWPVGTVSGRLSRGRQLLKDRLERRGVAVPSAMLATSRWLDLPSATAELLSPPLVESTLAAAARLATAGTIPAAVQSLTQGVLRTMLLDKIKTVSLALVVLGIGTGGVAWTLHASRAANSPEPQQAAPGAPPRVAVTKPEAATHAPNAAMPGVISARPQGPGGAGGMAGMMGSFTPAPPGKNYPNMVDPRHPMPVFRTQDILVVESPDRRSIQAMSLAAGDQDHAVWSKFTLPPGVTATRMSSFDTLAPIWKGKRIDQVAAFSRYTGVWAVQKLNRPAEEELTPYLAPGGAIYQVGNDVYAFSARKGTWGALHLEGTEKPRVSASPSDIEVLQGNKLYVFSIKHGQWSPGVEIYLKPSGPAPDRTR